MNKEEEKSKKLPNTDHWFIRNLTEWNVKRVRGNYLKFRTPRLNYFKAFTLSDKYKKNNFRVHYTADPNLIWSILGDPSNDLSLSHYDKALSNLEQPISLLLGENQRQNYSWKILAKALSIETGANTEDVLDAPLERQNTEAIEKITNEACLAVLARLKSKKKFNVIRDYGYIIPYMVGLKFTGIKKVDRTPIYVRLFTILRNISLRSYGSGRLKFWSKNGSADTFLLWTATMFWQIFGNPGNINHGPRVVAGWGASKYYKNIQSSFENSDKAPNYSLIKRLLSVEDHFVSKKTKGNEDYCEVTAGEYRDMAICLLLEIMTSFHILIGISFANMWQSILNSEGGVNAFITDLRAAHEEDKKNCDTVHSDRIINDILSKNSTTAMIYRVARRPFPEYGIAQGDYLCFRIKQASKYVKDSSNALNFGPHEKCPYALLASGERKYPSDCGERVSHPCFGQFWARTVLKFMFLNLLEEIPEIKPLQKNVKELMIPELLMVRTGK